MQIETLAIWNVGPISDLTLRLNPGVNIICGRNGVGKSTVLESIAHLAAVGSSTHLNRRADADNGTVRAQISHRGQQSDLDLQVSSFEPASSHTFNQKTALEFAPFILYMRTERLFDYTPLRSISGTKPMTARLAGTASSDGIAVLDVKDWFVHRYLYAPHQRLDDVQLANHETARTIFELLDTDHRFSYVDPETNDIVVSTPFGNIVYEYLSAGFRSCWSIIAGVIKELERRFPHGSQRADMFDGVIMIDEIELHLHPSWQVRIMEVLQAVFLNAQLIVTTHSPHVIQRANHDQIVVLDRLRGQIVQLEPPQSAMGYQGWTIEEILADVMGMADSNSDVFSEAYKRLVAAAAEDDTEALLTAYRRLDRMLHPQSELRKVMRLQFGIPVEEVHGTEASE